VNSTGNGTGANAGVLSAMCASLRLLLEYVKHVVNTILYIVGCPVDRIGLWCGMCQATVAGWIDSLRGSGSGSSSGGEAREAELSGGSSSRGAIVGSSGGGPRYARLAQSSQHGAGAGAASTATAGEASGKDEMSSSV
jgi:hypothetical protein